MSASPTGPVSLHIERLVVDCPGMSRGDAVRFERAMRTELTRLTTARPGALQRGAGAMPALSAPPVPLGTPLRPTEFGRQIARSLFDALAGGP